MCSLEKRAIAYILSGAGDVLFDRRNLSEAATVLEPTVIVP